MRRYVCGLAFTPGGKLALIKKTHPAWQAGQWNGIGGLIEEDEPVESAMAREFEEEAGVHIPALHWRHFLTLTDGRGWTVEFLTTRDDRVQEVRTVTEEMVGRNEPEWWLAFGSIIPNLRWIIPLAMQSEVFDQPVLAVEREVASV